jgi:hypothetical protein
MQHIELSTSERRNNAFSEQTLKAAIVAMQEDGYVCLPNVIHTDYVDALNEKMQADIRQVEKERGIDDNYQGVRPPPFHPYLYEDILFNPFAVSVSHALFGDDCTLSTYGANTAFAGSKPQRVHADATQLWSELDQATHWWSTYPWWMSTKKTAPPSPGPAPTSTPDCIRATASPLTKCARPGRAAPNASAPSAAI